MGRSWKKLRTGSTNTRVGADAPSRRAGAAGRGHSRRVRRPGARRPRRPPSSPRCWAATRAPSASPSAPTPASARCPSCTSATKTRRSATCPSWPAARWIAAYALTEPDAGSDALGGQDDGRAQRRRQALRAQRAEAVDHQRRLRRRVHRLRQGRRSASPPSSSAGMPRRRQRRPGSEQDGHQRLLHHAWCTWTTSRCRWKTCLGEVDRGHVIAFNVLNLGRWKLAAGALGACKALHRSVGKVRAGAQAVRRAHRLVPAHSAEAGRTWPSAPSCWRAWCTAPPGS